MNDLTTLARVKAIMGDELGRPADQIGDDDTLDSLGMDSIDCISLTVELDNHFDVELPDYDEKGGERTAVAIAAQVDALLAGARSHGIAASETHKDVTRGTTADRTHGPESAIDDEVER